MSFVVASLLIQALSVSLGDRTEARVRTGDGSAQVDLTTQGRAALQLQMPRASWELSYVPMWMRLGVANPTGTSLESQSGNLVGQLRLTHRTSAYFAESATYGTQNFRLLSVAAAPGSDSATANSVPDGTNPDTAARSNAAAQSGVIDRTVKYESLSTSARLAHQLSRREATFVAASYVNTGGSNQLSLTTFPRTKTLTGNAGISDSVSPHDSLSLIAGGAASSMPSIMSSYNGSLEAGWMRTADALTNARLSAGASYWIWDGASGEKRRMLLPLVIATVTYGQHLGRTKMSVIIDERLAPVIDRFLGTVYEQWGSRGSIAFESKKVILTGSAYAVLNMGSVPHSSRYVSGAAESISYQLNKQFMVEFGFRQAIFGLGESGPATVLWATYVAVAYSSGMLQL
jgi:hypothetical protein